MTATTTATIEGPGGPLHLSEDHVPASPNFREEKEELERVLNYPEISRSTSAVRFLSFICRKYFEGKPEEIREYSIALEALSRKESSFDPNVDPIVRVTARTLRKRLAKFYANEGESHRLQITLPRGHYVPQFIRRPTPGEEGNSAPDSIPPQDDRSREEPLGEKPAAVSGASSEHVLAEGSAATMARKFVWRSVLFALLLLLVFLAGYYLGRRTADPARARRELNLAAGGDWPGDPDGTRPVPTCWFPLM